MFIEELEEYEYPDDEAKESAYAGWLDVHSNKNLLDSINLVKLWLKYRLDNYFNLTHWEEFLHYYINHD